MRPNRAQDTTRHGCQSGIRAAHRKSFPLI